MFYIFKNYFICEDRMEVTFVCVCCFLISGNDVQEIPPLQEAKLLYEGKWKSFKCFK